MLVSAHSLVSFDTPFTTGRPQSLLSEQEHLVQHSSGHTPRCDPPFILPHALLLFVYKPFPLAFYHPIIQYKESSCSTLQPALLFIVPIILSLHSRKMSVLLSYEVTGTVQAASPPQMTSINNPASLKHPPTTPIPGKQPLSSIKFPNHSRKGKNLQANTAH